MVQAGLDEHIIKCSYCGRDLIVKDIVNNGIAFLSHLKNDHGIFYTPQRMVSTKTRRPPKLVESQQENPDLSTNKID